MGKYSDTLEKIQNEKERRRGNVEKAPVKVFSEDKVFNQEPHRRSLREKQGAWDRGIHTDRNPAPVHEIVMLRHPASLVSEQFRMLRTGLKAELAKNQAKVMLVSSSIHSEGKTVTAANLAVALAEDQEKRVLLIDADLRRGKVSEVLGFDKSRLGLTEYLSSDIKAREAMVRGQFPNLVCMPRGEVAKSPQELINSSKLKVLLAEMRKQFDYIIIDSAPIMSVADSGVLAPLTDGVLFIVQIGRTPKHVIAHAQQLFYQTGTRMLGHVLTQVQYQSSEYQYYYYDPYHSKEVDNPEAGWGEKVSSKITKWSGLLRQNEQKLNVWWAKKNSQKKKER